MAIKQDLLGQVWKLLAKLNGQDQQRFANKLADFAGSGFWPANETDERLSVLADRICESLTKRHSTWAGVEVRRANANGRTEGRKSRDRKRQLADYQEVIDLHNRGIGRNRAAEQLGMEPSAYRQRLKRAYESFPQEFTRSYRRS